MLLHNLAAILYFRLTVGKAEWLITQIILILIRIFGFISIGDIFFVWIKNSKLIKIIFTSLFSYPIAISPYFDP
jgi:hypothetical protein